jgi:hypothetical protein
VCGFENATYWNATDSAFGLEKSELEVYLEMQWNNPTAWMKFERFLNVSSIVILGTILFSEIWIVVARGRRYFASGFPLFSERGLISNLFDVALVGLPLMVSTFEVFTLLFCVFHETEVTELTIL